MIILVVHWYELKEEYAIVYLSESGPIKFLLKTKQQLKKN